MGHVITPKGVKPDVTKVTAINNMLQPEDKKGLQRLLGMTRYLAQYIPNEATITAPLRQLLRQDAVWQWNHEHGVALEKLKSALTHAPVLRFYDQTKPLTIQADASKDRLGACLLRCLTPHVRSPNLRKNHAQIEKELLKEQRNVSTSMFMATQ